MRGRAARPLPCGPAVLCGSRAAIRSGQGHGPPSGPEPSSAWLAWVAVPVPVWWRGSSPLCGGRGASGWRCRQRRSESPGRSLRARSVGGGCRRLARHRAVRCCRRVRALIPNHVCKPRLMDSEILPQCDFLPSKPPHSPNRVTLLRPSSFTSCPKPIFGTEARGAASCHPSPLRYRAYGHWGMVTPCE